MLHSAFVPFSQVLALLALFISSPCVLGVEFHFDCELRDASSVSPEHGELVLTANVVKLPTEAELIHEFGEIYHLDENGLQGPFLRWQHLVQIRQQAEPKLVDYQESD